LSEGNLKKGVQHLGLAVYYNPPNSSEYLANIPQSKPVYQFAIRKAREELRRKPTLLNRIVLGCLLSEASCYEEARQIFAEIRREYPGYYVHLPYYNVFYQEGKIFLKTQRWKEAGQILKEGTKMDFPILQQIKLNYMLGLALTGAGEKEPARLFFKKSRELALSVLNCPEQWDLSYAYICAECGFLEDAAYRYNKILSKWPKFHAARVSYTNLLIAIGDLEEAHKELLYLTENSPQFRPYALKKMGELEGKF